jgi:hypothetical protein
MTLFETIKEFIDGKSIEGDELKFQNSIEDELFHIDVSDVIVNELKKIGIKFKLVDNYGGEGKGDSFWSTYKFTREEETCYIKFDGSYASYDGAHLHEYFEVEPQEVTVIQYKKK